MFYDVNGDNYLTPLDVLIVINAINSLGNSQPTVVGGLASVSDPNNNGVVLANNLTIQGQTLANSLVTVSRTVVLNCSEVPCTSGTVEDNRSTLVDAQWRFTFDLPVAEGLQTVRSQYFHGRERDEAEVKGYYAAAIHELEATVARKGKVTELTIQTLHALVMGSGKKRLCPFCGRNHRSDCRRNRGGCPQC